MTLVSFRVGGRRGPAMAPALAVATLLFSGTAFTQDAPPTAECCSEEEDRDPHGLIWTGHQEVMPIEQLAAYAAPILWFSPDEPLLKEGQGPRRLKGKNIALPVRRILQREDEPGPGAYVEDPRARGQSLIDL